MNPALAAQIQANKQDAIEMPVVNEINTSAEPTLTEQAKQPTERLSISDDDKDDSRDHNYMWYIQLIFTIFSFINAFIAIDVLGILFGLATDSPYRGIVIVTLSAIDVCLMCIGCCSGMAKACTLFYDEDDNSNQSDSCATASTLALMRAFIGKCTDIAFDMLIGVALLMGYAVSFDAAMDGNWFLLLCTSLGFVVELLELLAMRCCTSCLDDQKEQEGMAFLVLFICAFNCLFGFMAAEEIEAWGDEQGATSAEQSFAGACMIVFGVLGVMILCGCGCIMQSERNRAADRWFKRS